MRYLPGIALVRSYRRRWLRRDLLAGVVLTALLVPQGMAYAELAGLPPAAGLYATMVPLLAYAVFGPSRILILGPDSAVAPVVAAAIIPIAGADMDRRAALAAFLAILVGGLMVIGGMTGVAFVTDLLSLPVRIGYLIGIAVTVIVSQLPALIGYESTASGLLDEVRALPDGLADADALTMAIGASSLALILVMKAFAPKVPGVLIAVVASTGVVGALGLADRLPTVGRLPQGLPSLVVPTPGDADLVHLALVAVAIALVAFADTSVLSRSYATRYREDVDQNSELVGLGAANLLTGFFQGFPISSSSSRTPAAEAAGARTQLAGASAAVCLGAVLVFGAGLFRNLPSATLAAIVVAAMLSLIDVAAVRRLYGAHRMDFALAATAFAAVAALGVLRGVGAGVAVSLAAFLWRSWHPHDATLGRADHVKGYHDVARYPDAKLPPGLVLYRFDAPLFFANAGVFRARVLALAKARQPRWIVIAAEPITDVDSTSAEMLVALHDELQALGVELAFAELKDHVTDTLRRFGFVERVGADRFYLTLGVAVRAYVTATGVPWQDWEDEAPNGG
jgi:high affinity sulfate transporter 1